MMIKPPFSLVVIVLNYRTPDLTVDCLWTLAAENAANPGRFQVVLIDNASPDDSVPRLREAIERNGWVDWLEFRPFAENLGFAGGNNAVMRQVLAEDKDVPYVLLLNSDTLVGPGCIDYCVKAMDADAKVGALSCQLLNRDGSVQNVCRRFPRPDRETVRAFGLPWMLPRLFSWADLEDSGWDRRKGPRDVEWIGGAFMMLRASALRKSGVFDEGFFFYGEDCELCHRIWKSGYRVRFDPGAETVHLGGGSSDSQRLRNRTKDVYTWKARFLVQRKCYGMLAEWWSRGAYIAAFAARAFLMRLRGQTDRKYQDVREGLRMLLRPLRP